MHKKIEKKQGNIVEVHKKKWYAVDWFFLDEIV